MIHLHLKSLRKKKKKLHCGISVAEGNIWVSCIVLHIIVLIHVLYGMLNTKVISNVVLTEEFHFPGFKIKIAIIGVQN